MVPDRLTSVPSESVNHVSLPGLGAVGERAVVSKHTCHPLLEKVHHEGEGLPVDW